MGRTTEGGRRIWTYADLAALPEDGKRYEILEGELVVMSQELYEEMTARLELYQKLDEAEFLEETGHKGKPHAEVMKSLRARLA